MDPRRADDPSQSRFGQIVPQAEIAIGDTLIRAYTAQEFDRIVVVAEPRMLGAIRLRLTPTLRRAVVKEIAKDLTKLPPQDLYRALEADVGRHGAA
ncbi:host attachment protein [Shinella sp. S4-D37]|uniref:host attachment protein n=1 Tax=Shinella sp. S4-D37 TaxID=3161999 RepID=UPI00346788AA